MHPATAVVLFACAVLTAACGLEATAPPERTTAPAEIPTASVPAPTTSDAAPPAVTNARSETPRIVRRDNEIISYSGSATPAELRSAHLAAVERAKRADRWAEYMPQFDHWHRLDLDADGEEEWIVFFTIEGYGGGNNFERYVEVYRYVRPVWIASNGDGISGGAIGDVVRLSGADLWAKTKRYAGEDPRCCPSIDAEEHFRVTNGARLEFQN